MSMTRAAYHLNEARTSITVAIDHLHKAAAADPDPRYAEKVYADARSKLNYADVLLMLRNTAGGPDLDRETAAIDASREAPCTPS